MWCGREGSRVGGCPKNNGSPFPDSGRPGGEGLEAGAMVPSIVCLSSSYFAL